MYGETFETCGSWSYVIHNLGQLEQRIWDLLRGSVTLFNKPTNFVKSCSISISEIKICFKSLTNIIIILMASFYHSTNDTERNTLEHNVYLLNNLPNIITARI